jgi:hypothetical protein
MELRKGMKVLYISGYPGEVAVHHGHHGNAGSFSPETFYS